MGFSQGKIDRAINLCDQTPFNYAHWMTEFLLKLTYLETLEEFRNWPILIDGDINDNYVESIRAVFPMAKELITARPHEHVMVDDLINVSPTSSCPHEFRDFHDPQKSGLQFFFSQDALLKLRSSLREAYSRFENGRARRLYLKERPWGPTTTATLATSMPLKICWMRGTLSCST